MSDTPAPVPKKAWQVVVRGQHEHKPSLETQLARLRGGELWTTDGRYHRVERLTPSTLIGTWKRFAVWSTGNGPSKETPRAIAALLLAEIHRRGIVLTPHQRLKAGMQQVCSVASCGRPAHVVASGRQYCHQHRLLGERLRQMASQRVNIRMETRDAIYRRGPDK